MTSIQSREGKDGSVNSEALAHYNRTQGRAACIEAAHQWQKANRSDPFAFTTALSHMLNGLARADEYSTDFKKEQVEVVPGVIKTVEIPQNMKRL